MRKQTRKFIIWPLPLFLLLMAMGACTDKIGDPNDNPEPGITKEIVDSPVDMIAGQNMVIGQCSWVVEEEGLHVFIALDEPWLLEEVHIDIADAVANLHRNRGGNLVPGQFDYVFPEIYDGYFDFLIPIDVFEGLCEEPFVMAVHAAVFMEVECPEGEEPPCYQYETAWANGTQTGKNWGMYVETDPGCYDEQGDPEPIYVYETAFAYHADLATCFLDDGFNRWGWTNGPVAPMEPEQDPWVFELYAGAGQCNLENGQLAGTVSLTYIDGVATVSFALADGLLLDETHLYVGNGMYPLDGNGNPTVAPGQYPYSGDETFLGPYVIDGLSGDIYMIFHAVVGIPQ
jgi:hypothetical protein